MGLEKDKQNYHTMGNRGGQCARRAFNLRFSEYINPFDATLESRIPGITNQVFTPESEIQYLNTLTQSLVQGRGHQEIRDLVITDNWELLCDIRKNKPQLSTIRCILSINEIIQS